MPSFLSIAVSIGAMSVASFLMTEQALPSSQIDVSQSRSFVNLGLSQPIQLRLDEFTITTDSVVATAKVRYSRGVRRITIRWGDGTESKKQPWIPGLPTGPEDTFQHVYIPPSDGKEFGQFVTVSIESWTGTVDIAVLGIVITPRYEVVQYTASFRALDNCDSIIVESTAEFEVTRALVQQFVYSGGKKWRFDDPLSGITPGRPWRPLDGSAFRREFVASDGELAILYTVIETDWLTNDYLGVGSTRITPMFESKRITHTLRTDNAVTADCAVEIRYDVEVNLLKPGLSPEHVLSNQFHD